MYGSCGRINKICVESRETPVRGRQIPGFSVFGGKDWIYCSDSCKVGMGRWVYMFCSVSGWSIVCYVLLQIEVFCVVLCYVADWSIVWSGLLQIEVLCVMFRCRLKYCVMFCCRLKYCVLCSVADWSIVCYVADWSIVFWSVADWIIVLYSVADWSIVCYVRLQIEVLHVRFCCRLKYCMLHSVAD